MENYRIEVVETLSRVVEVEALNIDEALEAVCSMYFDTEEIVLDSSDIWEVEFNPL